MCVGDKLQQHKPKRTEIVQLKKRKNEYNGTKTISTRSAMDEWLVGLQTREPIFIYKWNKIVATVKNWITLYTDKWFYWNCSKERAARSTVRKERNRNWERDWKWGFRFDFAYRLVVPFTYVLHIHFIIDVNIRNGVCIWGKRMHVCVFSYGFWPTHSLTHTKCTYAATEAAVLSSNELRLHELNEKSFATNKLNIFLWKCGAASTHRMAECGLGWYRPH